MEAKENLRGSGILLSISSLPSPYGIGTLGREAYNFVDLLGDLKQKYWQVLPVGPTIFGDSPYQPSSGCAGNIYFIDLDKLVDEGLLEKEEILGYNWGTDESEIDYAALHQNRCRILQKAFERFDTNAQEFQDFVKKQSEWLEQYALFMTLKTDNLYKNWSEWPSEYRNPQTVALEKYQKKNYNTITFWKFCQYKFFEQWEDLKNYANSKGVYIIGDISFYVGYDSVDVWAERQLFMMSANDTPEYVAAAGPDKYSESGQVWGNPFDNGWYLNAFYAANGCTIFGDGTDKAAGYDFGGDKGTAVTNYIVDLFANPNFVMDNNEGSLGLAGLKDGSINAYFNGNWNYDKVKEALGEENVGVAALPTINIGGKDCQLKAFLGSKAIGVNPNCKNQEVAVKLAAFLGSEDAQLAHFKLRAQAPVNKDLATNEEIAADPVAAAMAKVSTDCSVAQPIIDMSGYWDAATPFGDAFQNGAEGQITKDNAAQKTEDFNTQLNDSLK